MHGEVVKFVSDVLLRKA